MLIDLYKSTIRWLDRQSDLLPLLARIVFAGVLLLFFWASAATKLDSFPFGLSLGSYAQIFPRAMEAAGYDIGKLGLYHYLVVLAGTYGEFILPALIVLGLATRLAALGMIGFVIVLTLTDIIGHKAGPETIGAWFDRDAASLIADQRALWLVLLAILVLRGAGPLSLDRLFARRFGG
jgi:putative oxidoreductase